MNQENGTEWMSIRKLIKSKLAQCEYLEPFIIEDSPSEIPSTQLFMWNITQTDLLVILLKDDIRPGTRQEIEKAISINKPILIYFIESNHHEASVMDFKNSLINADRLTFKNLDNFDDIESRVLNDVINNLINYYRFTHGTSNFEIKNNQFLTQNLAENGILNKQIISSFGDNSIFLSHLLSLNNYYSGSESVDNSKENGNRLLKWLSDGDSFIDDHDTELIIEQTGLSDEIVKILKIRHQAIAKYFLKDISGALQNLDQAYELSKDGKIPRWLSGDILIDCRNIQATVSPFDNKYVKKIESLKDFVNFPIGDRFVKMAFEILEKERVDFRTLSPSTIRIGNTLFGSLQNIEEYLYASFIIGSSTHLLLARKKMIEILLEYGDLYEDENLIYQALRLIVVAGEEKLFSKVLNKYWDKVSDVVSVNVNQLWDLTDNKYCINSDAMKLLVIKSLGQFMSDSLFRQSTVFMVQFSRNCVENQYLESLLEASNHNLKRIDNSFVLDIIINILNNDGLIIYGKLANLLNNIDLDGCDQSDIKKLATLLESQIDKIVQNGGSYEFIINLLKQSKKSFKELYESIQKTISASRLNLIKIELGHKELLEDALRESISTLEKRFNPSGSIQIGYADNPMENIKLIIQKFGSEEIVDILNKKFIPLVIKVLSSNTVIDTKESYLGTLITILIEYKRLDQNVPCEIKELFLYCDISLNDEPFFTRASSVSSAYYINTIKSLLHLNTEQSIFESCINYKGKKSNERSAFSYSIYKYLEYEVISNNEIPRFIDLVIFDLLRDPYFIVRRNALECLLLIYNSNPSAILKRELIRTTLDSSPNVKGFYIELLKNNIINSDETRELLGLFVRDASYNIRRISREILSSDKLNQNFD